MKSVFYGIETLNKKDMTNKEKLSKALQNFKTKYPSITSADLQTFIIGWQEAVKNCFTPDVSGSCNQCDCDEIAKHPKITDRVCQKCGHRWSVI